MLQKDTRTCLMNSGLRSQMIRMLNCKTNKDFFFKLIERWVQRCSLQCKSCHIPQNLKRSSKPFFDGHSLKSTRWTLQGYVQVNQYTCCRTDFSFLTEWKKWTERHLKHLSLFAWNWFNAYICKTTIQHFLAMC